MIYLLLTTFVTGALTITEKKMLTLNLPRGTMTSHPLGGRWKGWRSRPSNWRSM